MCCSFMFVPIQQHVLRTQVKLKQMINFFFFRHRSCSSPIYNKHIWCAHRLYTSCIQCQNSHARSGEVHISIYRLVLPLRLNLCFVTLSISFTGPLDLDKKMSLKFFNIQFRFNTISFFITEVFLETTNIGRPPDVILTKKPDFTLLNTILDLNVMLYTMQCRRIVKHFEKFRYLRSLWDIAPIIHLRML